MNAVRASLVALLFLASLAAASAKTGIVVMHGKEAPGNAMAPLGRLLSDAGYLVEVPEMCWSKARIYDRTYVDCMGDVNAAADKLRKRGASQIVILGQSIGGNFALGYGARHTGLHAVIVISGGHNPGGIIGSNQQIAKAYADAQKMVKEGNGDRRMRLPDTNDTGPFFVMTTPKIYVSWFDPAGDANMHFNARKLSAPLLWVSGDADPAQRFSAPIFDQAPKHPLNRHVTIKATHRSAPVAARDTIVGWLKEVAAGK